ncbi:MAG TPA: DUF5671 domain-containing protein [Actinomycetales bacterium]|nr:DUF5671 domain-containing protein [Actinomycetales bacterium]
MFVSLVVTVALVVGMVVLVRRRQHAAPGRPGASAAPVREFFQYLLLFGLVVVVAIGVAGLLGRALEGDSGVQDDVALARNLAFVVVGSPLLALVVWWSAHQLVRDPAERTSPALALTVVLAGVTSLVVVMTSGQSVLGGLLTGQAARSAIGRLIAWSVVLGAAWWMSTVIVPAARRGYHLIGSVLGLGTLIAGLTTTLGDLGFRALFGPDADPYATDWRDGLATALVGAVVWAAYWWGHARRAERDTRWLAYVLLAGVGGGFVVALVSLITALSVSMIWVFGDPGFDVARVHFHDVPTQAAAAVVGLSSWWYHRTVLRQYRTTARTGVQRLYEYLLAGIALVAAAAGVMVLVAAGIESVTSADGDGSRGPVVNTVIAAASVLVIGLPVWATFWRRVQLARRADPASECGSVVRRTYLGVIVGIGAIAAVAAAITGVYLLFHDAVTATVASSTWRSMRYPIGIVLAAGAVAAGNAVQLKRDRDLLPSVGARGLRGGRHIVLVGTADPAVARAVAHATGARVETWWSEDGVPWSVDEVVRAVMSLDQDAVVVCGSDGVRVIPARRGGARPGLDRDPVPVR